MGTTGVHDGHRARRRKLFAQVGLDGFEDHEVLELLLFYALPRCDTNEIAHNLMDTYGTLRNVLCAPVEELKRINGIGERAAELLALVEAIHLRRNKPELPKQIIDSSDKAGRYFFRLLHEQPQEQLHMLCADGKGKVLSSRMLSKGTGDMTAVDMRRVMEAVVYTKCSIVMLGHNHPSGIALPSDDDVAATRHLQDTLLDMGVYLLDHFVITDDDYISMADSGYIKRLEGVRYAGF